ncbi:hypothetical protein Rxycam_01365 [Rubrobacter xylanophilus DSM 9941]|uniref:hypothetical protein n=1 Tax=Rubrobacter xylanophilus TaxID=49319 RepID=UPI001C640C0C|nr:hypothetical protein [Rubrobacter xylanophilus]QYJ15541.1 hypothetical protein Rxycam_01365 [Rubrobacter xylanophilus DSM 9941]
MEEAERKVEEILFALVLAWEDSNRCGQAVYDGFVRDNPPPVLPARLENAAELARYNLARAEYEARLDAVTRQKEELRKRFLEAAREALPILPEGTPVLFRVPDDWTRGDLQGCLYEIEHLIREGAPVVEVTKLGDSETALPARETLD